MTGAGNPQTAASRPFIRVGRVHRVSTLSSVCLRHSLHASTIPSKSGPATLAFRVSRAGLVESGGAPVDSPVGYSYITLVLSP